MSRSRLSIVINIKSPHPFTLPLRSGKANLVSLANSWVWSRFWRTTVRITTLLDSWYVSTPVTSSLGSHCSHLFQQHASLPACRPFEPCSSSSVVRGRKSNVTKMEKTRPPATLPASMPALAWGDKLDWEWSAGLVLDPAREEGELELEPEKEVV